MEEAKIISYSIDVKIKYKCPHCEHEDTTEFSGSAYRSLEEDPVDVMCKNCKEFLTLQL